MANAQKIGRDDWIRTSDPLNPIYRTDIDVTDRYGWRSDRARRDAEANLWANHAEHVHSALPIAIVILTLLALLSWEFYHYAQAFADKAAQAMAGPWA